MSKPWDNEPTTITDKHSSINPKSYLEVITSDYARDIERRMRAAERLLEDKMCGRECKCCKEAKAHLESANKEDGQ